MPPKDQTKVVFISSISSDIGLECAQRYARDGYTVAGTYRSRDLLPQLKNIPGAHLFYCDLEDTQSIYDAIHDFAKLNLRWETFISCASWPPPLTAFFKEKDFDKWSRSVHVNAIEQFRLLHGLYPYRRAEPVAHVVFFAGPGTNNAVKNFSALTVAKIMLIKMCELLDAENDDLNVFIIGPGWTKTKTHEKIMSDPDVSPEKYKETKEFMTKHQGTSMDEIYDHIRWLCRQGKAVAGGRNFSTVHDVWGTAELAEVLKKDLNMYKLRRYRNEWKDKGGHQQ